MYELDFQTWLDVVGQTIFDDDFDAYAAHVCVPFTLITQQETLTVPDRGGLRRGFDVYVNMFRTLQVTDMIRTASGVTAMGSDLLCGNYETHILRGGLRIVPPFMSSMVLRAEGGTWRAASITNSWSNKRWPISFPEMADQTNAAIARSGRHYDARPWLDAIV